MVGGTRILHEIGAAARRSTGVRHGRDAARVKAVLDMLIPARERRFGVRLWDGSFVPPAGGVADWVLVLNTPAVLSTVLLHPDELTLGEAFLHGDWAVEGDLEQVFGLAEAIGQFHPHWRDLLRVAPLLIGGLRQEYRERGRVEEHRASAAGEAHTRARDRQAIRYHYDVGNDFYALWLDRNMVYSCAYFETAEATLDQAQEAKLDLICRKLRLRPGERFLDVGCGWGALARHAAAHYGVNATGITLSEAQAALARERIAAAGLADRCQVEVRDYRDLPAEWFDKAASVGMAEHVGTANLGTYFATVRRALKPGGLFLNHAIANAVGPEHRKGVLSRREHDSFIERHVFPDGELQPIHQTLAAAENAGLEVCDVESLRRHYALTLRHWRRRLEERRDEALATVDEVTYRVWQLYMTGAAHNFSRGNINVYQTLLSRPGPQGSVALPMTRADLYRETGRAEAAHDQEMVAANGVS